MYLSSRTISSVNYTTYRESTCSFLNDHLLFHFLTGQFYNHLILCGSVPLFVLHIILNCVSCLVLRIRHHCVVVVLATQSSISAVAAPFVSFSYLCNTRITRVNKKCLQLDHVTFRPCKPCNPGGIFNC